MQYLATRSSAFYGYCSAKSVSKAVNLHYGGEKGQFFRYHNGCQYELCYTYYLATWPGRNKTAVDGSQVDLVVRVIQHIH